MRKWMIVGALIGVLIGVIGTVITLITRHPSIITAPPLFITIYIFKVGVLYHLFLFNLLFTVLFWALVGLICGYLIDLRVKRNKIL